MTEEVCKSPFTSRQMKRAILISTALVFAGVLLALFIGRIFFSSHLVSSEAASQTSVAIESSPPEALRPLQKSITDLEIARVHEPPESPLPNDPSGLTATKRGHVNEALRLYKKPKYDPEVPTGPEDRQAALASRKLRIEYLSHFLTPEELLTYRINEDGTAFHIKYMLKDINPSEIEFRTVFEQLDNENSSRTNGNLCPDLEQKLREALGEARYAEYKTNLRPDNYLLNRWAERNSLTSDQLTRLKDLRMQMGDSQDLKGYQNAVHQVLQNNPRAEKDFFSSSLYYRSPKLAATR